MARLILTLLSLCLLTGCNDWRMWETPAVKPHEEPLLIMPEGTVPFDGGEALSRVADPEELKNPFTTADLTAVEAGKAGYVSYCIQCHGKYLDGNGTVGQSFKPLPTDLRSPKVQDSGDGALFQVIGYSKPESRHPALATTVTPEDRWRIITFIRSRGPR